MSLNAGVRIGPYEILSRLGAGGMGEVYHARDPRLGRAVAIKVLASARDVGAAQLDRFRREARALARVSHPHICTLYDVGEQDGVPFLVMEVLEGETLAERLEAGPLPLERGLAIAVQIAEGLDAAHSRGVIHRDLKTSNIMLTGTGVKLLDFGLAKLGQPDGAEALASTESLQLTGDGAVLGTLPYMAPEQIEGRDADARTDIFAFGVVLYEMATRRAPFTGPSRASLAAAILTHQPPPVSSLAPSTPASLTRIVEKCLAKNPDHRWQSVRDLGAALRWSADEVNAASVAGRPAGGRWRRPAAVIAGLAACAAAVAFTLSLSRGGRPAAAAPTGVRFTPITFRAGTVTSARFTADGETVVYSAAWGDQPYDLYMTRRGSVESRSLGLRNAKLLAVSSTGELAFLRGSHDLVKLLQTGHDGTLQRVSMTGGGVRDVLDDVIAADWRPGSNELAVVRRGRVEFPLGTTIYGRHNVREVRIAPDGQRLALVDGAEVVVLDRSGKRTVLTSDWGDLTSLAWSPDGHEVWFTSNRNLARNDLTTWALRAVSLNGDVRVVLPAAPVVLRIHDVFRDGRVLMARQVGSMGCSCLPAGAAVAREMSWLDGSAPEALSADGQTVLFGEVLQGGGTSGAIYLRRMDQSDAVRLGDGFPEDLSDDGKWVLAAPTGTRQHWVILPTGPGSPRTLPAGPITGRGEANFVRGGRQIVFGGAERGVGRRIYVQDVESGTIRAISPVGVSTDALTTTDGRYVVGRAAGRHALYALDGGAAVPLPFLTPTDLPLQWSVDGRTLYVERTETWPPAIDRIDMTTHRRGHWKTIQIADPTGVDAVFRILITPDAATYCHDYVRFMSQLFVVEGVR
jgi:hypothetical protein